MSWPEPPPVNPTWTLVDNLPERAREHELESLFAVSNGYAGTRGSLWEGNGLSSPATLIAGLYRAGEGANAVPELVQGPDWTRLGISTSSDDLTVAREPPHLRMLDLERGILFRAMGLRDAQGRALRMWGARFASLADRHLFVQSVAFSPENWSGPLHVDARLGWPALADPVPRDAPPPMAAWSVAVAGARATIGVAIADRLTTIDRDRAREERWIDAGARVEIEVELATTYRIDRLACLHTSRDAEDPATAAWRRLGGHLEGGAESALAAHAEAWRARWVRARVDVDGDTYAERALRFAGYHLIAAGDPEDPAVSIGARALTGPAYLGHVFWDTEIYVLPFYALTYAEGARALLAYRHRTLDAAREKARVHGYRGALYAWESTDTGVETTPPFVTAPDGREIRVLSGELEHHVSADVAYAVWQYWLASGDDGFVAELGAEILFETARFWASRVERGDDGLFHIRGVVGPDEYHGGVDDDAYTNEMARWNLERAAELAAIAARRWPDRQRDLAARIGLDDAEIRGWIEIARGIYSGLDAATGVYEQFRGYVGLEEIDLAAFEPRTTPMDMILGPERTRRSKVIKQADVVLLLHLLGDRFPREVALANYRYYEPRTGQGSSLSPPVHAIVAARLGLLDEAERWFRETAEIDLADDMGNASGGVHIGALGGLWQAAVFGFAGMRLLPNGLSFAPNVPARWRRLRFRAGFRDLRLDVAASADPRSIEVTIEGDGELLLGVESGPSIRAGAGRRYAAGFRCGAWSAWTEARS